MQKVVRVTRTAGTARAGVQAGRTADQRPSVKVQQAQNQNLSNRENPKSIQVRNHMLIHIRITEKKVQAEIHKVYITAEQRFRGRQQETQRETQAVTRHGAGTDQQWQR